jgi:hypothetical protein
MVSKATECNQSDGDQMTKQVRLDDKEAAKMLEILCKTDFRKENATVALLIRKEYKKRFGLDQIPEPANSISQVSERG